MAYHNMDEMDAYFDFTQFNQSFASPSDTKLLSNFSPGTIDPMHISPEYAEERQHLSGPTHPYELHPQQTPLPSRSLSTIAFGSSRSQPTLGASFNIEGYNSGFPSEMDFPNAGSQSMDTPYLPIDDNFMDEFIEPSEVATPVDTPATVTRVWPGMHTEQARMNQAQQQQRQQQMQREGQHIMSRSSSVATQGGKTRRVSSNASSDPAVEERISRLLDRMRQNSADSIDDEPSGDGSSGSSHRTKKEEELMDDDEKLLASEEGKKLSSKERRQLRNKVSARAFRSRRKEYISQLEGEVAARAQECSELKSRNRSLVDQNQQLTNLTQTLLRHPAFSTFLEDMSYDPTILNTLQAQALNPAQPQGDSQVDDAGDATPRATDHGAQDQDMEVHVASVPQPADFSSLNLGPSHWAASNVGLNYQQPRVYSVFEVPQGPSLEEISATRLSGKFENTAISKFFDIPLEPVTVAEHVPETQAEPNTDIDDAMPLYQQTANASNSTLSAPSQVISFSVPAPPSSATMVDSDPEVAAATINQMFDLAEPTRKRVEELTFCLSSL